MNEALIKEVFSDKDFVESLLGLETAEDVRAALKEKDLDLSIEDIENIRKTLTAQEGSELSEDEMENVAGGVINLAQLAAGCFGNDLINPASVQVTMIRRRW